MNQWIEINLPWNFTATSHAFQSYPHLEYEWKQLHSETVEDVATRLLAATYQDRNDILDIYNEFANEIDLAMRLEKYPGSDYDESWMEEKRRRLETLNNDIVRRVHEYRNFYRKYNDWYESHPEVIKVMAENAAAHAKNKAEEAVKSFCGRGLNQPGVLVEYEQNGELNQILIGHVDDGGFSCGEFSHIHAESLVKRYKIVWEPNQEV